MPRQQILAFAAGAFTASAYFCRRGIAREWRWACRDLSDFRAELMRYRAA